MEKLVQHEKFHSVGPSGDIRGKSFRAVFSSTVFEEKLNTHHNILTH